MFKHSVKVPRLYKVAATIAKEVSEGLGSVKQRVYEKQKKHPNIKALYALVATLFQKSQEIETILKRSQFLTKESRLDIWLAKILIVELLWGRKILPGQSKPECTVRAYEQIFKAHLSDDKTVSTKPVDTQATLKPRYVRVNSLSMTINEAVEGFRDEGWILSNFLDKSDYQGFLNKITSLKEDEFLVDIHIPNLLIFPPKTEFYNHPAYKNGSIILQDKASCLPVHILGPPPGSKVLDMCAAPGMKTTHLAAVLNDEGTVYATERDPRRFEILNRIIESSGAKCIQSLNKDVLTCTAQDFSGVEYILVDPSCSGSGMTDRLEAQVKGDTRLEKLTGFQIKILRSALARYPDAKRVVYSTCSIYPEENEDVVRQVLETNYNFKLIPASPFVGGAWQNFGSNEYGDIGKFCLYAKPNEDFTNGFFIAVFERLKEGEENQFFNTRIFNFKKHIQAKEKRRDRKRNLADASRNPESDNAYEVTEKDNVDQEVFQNNNESDNKDQREDKMDNKQLRKKKKKGHQDEDIVQNSEVNAEQVGQQSAKLEEELDYKESQKKMKKKKKRREDSNQETRNNDDKYAETIENECDDANENYENAEVEMKTKKNKKKLRNDKEFEIDEGLEASEVVENCKNPSEDCSEQHKTMKKKRRKNEADVSGNKEETNFKPKKKKKKSKHSPTDDE